MTGSPTSRVEGFLAWLERGGLGAIPIRMLPPIDAQELLAARDRARDLAIQTGRVNELGSYRAWIVEWALALYRRHGLTPVYFTGWWSPADRRTEGVEVLIDVMTAYLLSDVLPADVAITLMTQFDVLHGIKVFEPGPGSGDD